MASPVLMDDCAAARSLSPKDTTAMAEANSNTLDATSRPASLVFEIENIMVSNGIY